MVRGIYSSAAGMIAQYKKLDVLGDNAANVNTPGFKQSSLNLVTFGQEMAMNMSQNSSIGSMPMNVTTGSESTDFSEGTLSQTGINTDLGISGSGLFEVQSSTGGIKYTRAGEFSVDGQGYLALSSGERLVGSNGSPLYVGGNSFNVAQDGTVTTSSGTAGKIDLYTAQTGTQVVKRADGFYDIASPQTATGEIKQGWLEGSNTDVVGNMTDMMATERAFQGCQEAFQVSDDTFDKLVTQVGTMK